MGQENFNEMRKAMVVSQLRTTDVSDPRIIAAMSEVAREDFVPAASRALAYCDRGVSIGEGRALNPPLATGLLLNAAGISAEDNVLLIGAATGYTAAVLARLAGSVIAVEQNSKLATKTKKNLEDIDNVRVEKAPHAEGFAKDAPYSVVIIDGVADAIPQALVNQLGSEGRLVAGVIEGGTARLAVGHKAGDVIGYQYFADCEGAPLPGFGQPKSFSF